MAKFMVKASEFKNVCKAVNDRQLESLKKEIIEILKKQDEKDVKKAIDYFNSQEEHYTHLEKSLISGKWIQKAGYGVGTVRIWKGKKYKKIAPGKWARVFDKEGRGTNIAIGRLIAQVNRIDNVEDLMAFVMQNKQRFVDENGIDLPVLDKLRAAVDDRNGNVGSKGTSKPAESTTTAELINKNKDKIEKYGIDIYKDEISNSTPTALKDMNEKELKDFIEFTDYLKKESEKIEANANNQDEKNKAYMSAAHSEQLNRKAKNRLKAVIAQNEPIKDFNTEVANSVDIENFKKELDDSYNSEFRVASRLSEGDTDYSEGAIKFDKLVKNDKGAKDFIEKISNTNVDEIDSSLYKTVVMDLLEKKGFFKESEAEKTQNRSEAMKGNQNARKFGAEWEEKRKEIQGKLTENTDKLLEDNDNAKDVYEKLQNHLNKRKADAELYRKYLGSQEEPEDVKDFRKWCDDVIEQYRKEVTNTPSKEIISKWEETARNTPTEKLEEVYNGKQKIDYSNEYENYIDSTIINTFAKDKDLIFPQPYTMLKDIATRKFDNSDKIRLEVIKKELDARKNGTKAESEKEPSGLGTFTKVDEKTVEMSANKSTKELFDNLNKSRSDDNTREFMTDCYYDGENIVSTDGKRMTIIKAENIGLEPGYVSVKTDGGKIRLESIKKEGLRTSFPNYKGVIPTRNNQEVKINNNALKEKLKAMKKDGKYSKKLPHIALDFEDGKVMLDGVQVGTADNVKFDDSVQRMIFNADYLKNALTSGDVSSMFVSDNPNKAMVIKTDVSDSIVMPYNNNSEVDYEKKAGNSESTSFERIDFKSMSDEELKDYEAKLEKELNGMNPRDADFMDKYNYWREVHGENNDRFHQRIEDEAKAEKQAEADTKSAKEKEINEKYNGYFENRKGLDKARDLKTLEKKYNFDGKVMSSKEFVEQAMDNGVEIKEREVNKLDYPSRTRWNRMNGYEQDEYEKRIKAAGKKTVYSIDGYEFPKTVVDYAKFYKEKKGNVKKSAFDDFVMDMFIDEDEEIEDAIKTDESLFNDYSAEQPELFNSTEMKVQEAFNRCGCCL